MHIPKNLLQLVIPPPYTQKIYKQPSCTGLCTNHPWAQHLQINCLNECLCETPALSLVPAESYINRYTVQHHLLQLLKPRRRRRAFDSQVFFMPQPTGFGTSCRSRSWILRRFFSAQSNSRRLSIKLWVYIYICFRKELRYIPSSARSYPSRIRIREASSFASTSKSSVYIYRALLRSL